MRTKDDYHSLILKYGVIAVLIVLEHHERRENFEDCQNIMDAIEMINSAYGKGSYLSPTRLNKESITEMKRQFRLSGYKFNMDSYMKSSAENAKLIIQNKI